ncbi:TPA: zonular occludens toxin domain-containing protein [Photobacterium damselae]
MAVAIYHGAAGSYKTASAVWFLILPALRAGRCVVTNIEGMKTVEEIERNLGERFPMSAKIIRILSNNENGLALWQTFYSWCPLGALIVIDEAQDIYNKTVGFDLIKNKLQPIDKLKDLLPAGYLDYYHRIFDSFVCPDAFKDDTGFSTVDSDGRPVLPLNYNSALMTHRHYNWDIYYLTPAIAQIDSSVRGVCEIAYHHKNKDSTIKRRPRIWEHDPKTTATKPDKEAVITYRKIPLDVFLLYKSTSTGKITKSGLGSSLFKNWKFWLFVVVMTFCITTLSYTLYDFKGIGYDYSLDSSQSVDESSSSAPASSVSQVTKSDNVENSIDGVSSSSGPKNIDSVSGQKAAGVLSGVHKFESLAEITVFLNQKVQGLKLDFNDLYLSSAQKIVKGGKTVFSYLFNYQGQYYSSDELSLLGFAFTYVNDCMTFVSHSGAGRLLSCDRVAKSWTAAVEDSPSDDLSLSNDSSSVEPVESPIVDLSSSALVSTFVNN